MADPLDGALALPPAALYHEELQHPDSVDAVRREHARTAKELGPIHENEVLDSGPSSFAHQSSFTPNLRARGVPPSPALSGYGPSLAPTAADSEGPDFQDLRQYRLRRQVPHWYDPIVKFWTTNVTLTIEEGSHRDHLALERTFLGYLRTSLAFSMTGVIISQLFRLQHSVSPNAKFGFFVLGIPLAAVFIIFGMLVLLVGAFRFWRQQSCMVRSKVHAGGWEVSFIMAGSILLYLAAFALILGVDIDKTY